MLLNELFEFGEDSRVHWLWLQIVCFQAPRTLRAERELRALGKWSNSAK